EVKREAPKVEVVQAAPTRNVQTTKVVTPVTPKPIQRTPVQKSAVKPSDIQIKEDEDFDALYHEAGCTCALCEWSNSDNYGVKFGGQFLRGLLNAATCWVELPVTTYQKTMDGDNPFIDPFAGLGEGAARTVGRAASGVLDVATSWVPKYKNQLIFKSKPTLMCD
ncbi:hypothetical protein ACFL3D_05830, partial [Candidatus Omnitrophota bacterium]